MRYLLLALFFFGAGFAGGLYSLPIIQAAKLSPPTVAGFTGQEAGRRGVFRDDLPGNDMLHWGRGAVLVTEQLVAFEAVELAPGPDYRLYLLPKPVEDESGFLAIKAHSVAVAEVKTFSGSAQYRIPAGVNVDDYQAVLVWCEAFGEFISMAVLDKRV